MTCCPSGDVLGGHSISVQRVGNLWLAVEYGLANHDVTHQLLMADTVHVQNVSEKQASRNYSSNNNDHEEGEGAITRTYR